MGRRGSRGNICKRSDPCVGTYKEWPGVFPLLFRSLASNWRCSTFEAAGLAEAHIWKAVITLRCSLAPGKQSWAEHSAMAPVWTCPLSSALESNPNESDLATQPSTWPEDQTAALLTRSRWYLHVLLGEDSSVGNKVRILWHRGEMNYKSYIKIVKCRQRRLIPGTRAANPKLVFLALDFHLYHQFLEKSPFLLFLSFLPDLLAEALWLHG